MATMTSVRVAESLQMLIDSRLDTIDRMLLGRLPRAERLEIVREVESQIFELLQERTSDEPTREDVLAVLARLDPPEAYLPEETGETGALSRPVVGSARPAASPSPRVPPRRKAALASGVLGLATLVLLSFIFPVVIGLANMGIGTAALIIWYMLTAVALIGSITGIALAVRARLQGNWAITGLVLGILNLLGSLGFLVLGMFL
jgi:HAAS